MPAGRLTPRDSALAPLLGFCCGSLTPLILQIAEKIHVLRRGELIASGPPDAIRRDPAVVESYLGSGPGEA